MWSTHPQYRFIRIVFSVIMRWYVGLIKGALAHSLIHSELYFLFCLISFMIMHTCGKFQFITCYGYFEDWEKSLQILTLVFQVPKGHDHAYFDKKLIFLLWRICFMILNTFRNVQSNKRNAYLNQLENIYLHANLNVAILSKKGHNSSFN